MNAIENLMRIIHFDHPERVIHSVPIYETFYYGCNHEGFAGGGHDSPVGSKWVDIWGTGWQKIHPDVMGMPVECPLSNPANLKSYTWPDPDDERICAQLYRMAGDFAGGDLLLAGHHRDTLWEKAYMLVGMENLMMYFFQEPTFVRDVLHHIMDFQLAMARHYLKIGVQFIFLGDDLGTQQGPLLGPRIVNDFLYPEYQRLFQLYRQNNVLIDFHSCGKIDSILDMFLELGVDILNPVQATANHLDALRLKTQGRMTLQGAVSSATIMEGPIQRIEKEIRQRMKQLGSEGGYICTPDQGMPYPPEHIKAFYAAVERFGKYPL
jgi:uroporphyrinogen decarboxylase